MRADVVGHVSIYEKDRVSITPPSTALAEGVAIGAFYAQSDNDSSVNCLIEKENQGNRKSSEATIACLYDIRIVWSRKYDV